MVTSITSLTLAVAASVFEGVSGVEVSGISIVSLAAAVCFLPDLVVAATIGSLSATGSSLSVSTC